MGRITPFGNYGYFAWGLRGFCKGLGILFDFSIARAVLTKWVNELLIPNLPGQSVIVTDNATFHKGNEIVTALREAGHTILWYRLTALI
ncbi:hypothetical protein [Neisseria iguanae]|uniref:Tc1-like transposase DDE domain-containing protein n=1 Tax=Neisseria iguanae TaxID=90242 RepID=A0A2P7TWX2_9NEIS|nr:hypothetical protein [Neisseria iguanae]PSJ79232.1 hypothetical protein C7N83_13470 [Neisseria iguanae]